MESESKSINKAGRTIAFSSFLMGTLLLLIFVLFKLPFIAGIGFVFILLGIILNATFLLLLLLMLIVDKNNRNVSFKTLVQRERNKSQFMRLLLQLSIVVSRSSSYGYFPFSMPCLAKKQPRLNYDLLHSRCTSLLPYLT